MTPRSLEIIRYGVNGVVATMVHYGILSFNLDVAGFSSAGLANLCAAVFGIVASFIGSRYFVFRPTGKSIFDEAARFTGLYAAIAALHGTLLFIWTDTLKFDYRSGFLVATIMQVFFSYLGNRYLVFAK